MGYHLLSLNVLIFVLRKICEGINQTERVSYKGISKYFTLKDTKSS